MGQRWALSLAVQGDLRFASHHDMLRAVQRSAHRADLPLSYSQGFSPRPKLSLTFPRPVGVASLDDLLVLTLDSGPHEPQQLTTCLQAVAPEGLTVVSAQPLPGKFTPQPLRAHFEMPLSQAQAQSVSRRLAQLAEEESWVVCRPGKPGARGRKAKDRPVDLRPLVAQIELRGQELHFELVGDQGRWARPAELMTLLGLDERVDLARMIRTHVQYTQPQPDEPGAQESSDPPAGGDQTG